ncbi:glycosyltransferase family 9 protein [Bordetella bronchiseptica]|uniref:glycosyltransferase family 9 protein n=1 Tax=Bordetella bronchiseptica TaxID=518 RepID=UPI000528922A|nr:glycosyltransferase family 9 protein [Bordetella bronchiseptica]
MAKPASDMPPYDKAAALRGLAGARRVALLMAPRLGDTLLMMNMARNLAAHGREVSIFGDYIHGLRDWFPGLDIRPSLSEEQAGQVLPGYDCAAQMHVGWPYALHAHQPNYFYYDAHVAVTGRGFVKLFQIRDFCREQLGLAQAGADNGLRPPPQVQPHRSHPRRVALHPTSTGAQRCWAPRHFKELGLRLLHEGYEPNYIVAPHERAEWSWVLDHGLHLPQFPSLSEVAGFIHASGWFIGNESGIGHLASNVGVPTLSLTGRPTRTRAWRPAWSTSRIVYPALIPGGRWRDRLWREWLSPRRVMSAFHKLQADDRRRPVGVPWGKI